MQKTMKKLLSIILAILMIVTTVPFAFAADVVTSGRDNGEDRDITWIIDSDRVLTISGSGLVGGRFYNFRDLFDTVIIEDGITGIASNVFASTYIKKAILPDSITSIGESAFHSCSQLEEITIPDSVTYIGKSAFSYCSGLKEITIPDSVTYIGESAFYSCSGLKEITLPYGLTSIEKNTFYSCGALEKITIPDSVETIGVNAFILCGALKNITIPDSVKTIEKFAFCNCRALETLTIPDGVVSIGDQAFSGCSNLKEITIPESVTSIGNSAFYGINENAIVNVPCSWDENSIYSFYTPSIAPNINSHIWSVDGSFGICDACGKKCDHTYLLEAKCSICGFENKADGIKTVLDFSKGCIIITDSKASCGYADVRFDPDGYIITGECRDEYGAPITIINDSGEEKTFDLVFRDLNINALDGCGAVRIVDNSPTTVNILVEGENVLTTNDRSMFIGGGDWYFGQPITKINVNLTKAENATIQFERLDGMAEIELFYFYDGNFIFTVDGKPVGGDMHFHENTDGIQSCKGYLCSICEQYYGEKDENAHEAGYQNCQGYFCDVCHDYFGEGTAHEKSYQSCMGWFCNGCQKFNYPEEKDESKHVWVYGICTYCRVAFPEGQECIHEWDVELQCTKCAYKCEHQFVENNICSVCSSEMNFTLTTGDTVTYHKFFARALDKAENGSKITLINDYYYGDNYDVFIQNNIIIDLNGHKWCPEPYLNMYILADVTITGATLEGYYTPSLRIYSPCKLYDGYYRSIMMENPEIEIDDLLPECRVFTAGEIYDTGLYYEEIAVTGEHSFTEYKEVKLPVCEEEGLKVAECDNGCGETDEKAIEALNHKDTLVQVEAKSPTCKEIGWDAYEYCTACDYTTYVEKAISDHKDDDNDSLCDYECGTELVVLDGEMFVVNGDVTNTGIYIGGFDAFNDCYKAGDGYITIIGEGNNDTVITLYDATIDVRGTEITDAIRISGEDVEIRFFGENNIFADEDAISNAIGSVDHSNVFVGEDNAVMNLYGNVSAHEITVESGTINIYGTDKKGEIVAVYIEKQLVVSENAVVNIISGDSGIGLNVGILAQKGIIAEGELNAITLNATETDDELIYNLTAIGDAVLGADTYSPYYGMEIPEDMNVEVNFIVPEGASVTVPEGITLNLDSMTNVDIDGELIVYGTLICTHTGGENTCDAPAVCDICGTEYGNIDADNHKDTLVQVDAKAPTCTEIGWDAYEYCTACEYSTYAEIPVDTDAHDIIIDEAVAPKCGESGLTQGEHCTRCDYKVEQETVPALKHSFTKYEVTEEAKCGVAGKEVAACDNGCGATDEKAIAALTHKDADGDYKCDNGCGHEFEKPAPEEPTPDTPDEPTDEVCDHLCHKGGFIGFIWKIVKFFSKLFKLNPVCECGAVHY